MTLDKFTETLSSLGLQRLFSQLSRACGSVNWAIAIFRPDFCQSLNNAALSETPQKRPIINTTYYIP
ncbi:hypothetical protein ACP6PL_04635 [Dapis sp. BLCC M126]|uniref:hypothetical protein n=1 Tax=Dapis sp. BLCC M126 TaxID=3400189 RepID=UPI003CFA4678